jgi:Holliday junction resolvasome RuvABC endonuclease subunit
MLYIGIDPGESWCGFAALYHTNQQIHVEARAYSIKAHGGYLSMTRDLLNLIPHNRPTQIICEDSACVIRDISASATAIRCGSSARSSTGHR